MANRIDEILGTTTKLRLIGAYGRNYYSETDVREAWESGYDFKIISGPYTSIRDVNAIRDEWDSLEIAYDKGYRKIFKIF